MGVTIKSITGRGQIRSRKNARRSEENIALQEVVVAGGCADFDPASDTTLRSVFERADSRMYEEKQRLKSLGARTRQEEKKR